MIQIQCEIREMQKGEIVIVLKWSHADDIYLIILSA